MPEMIATSEIEYPPGKYWKPGDRFPVEDNDAKLLQTLGRAKLPDHEPRTTVEIPPPPRRGRPPKAR